MLLALTPTQETFNSENYIPPLSLLRVEDPEQEISLPSLLKSFTALAEPDLISPPLSPLPQDRVLTAGFQFSVDSRLGSLEGEEVTTQSEEERWGLRERIVSQGSRESEEIRGVITAKTKSVGARAIDLDLLRDIL